MRRYLILPILALALAASSASVPAFAQTEADKNQARILGQEGQAALDAKDFKTAEDRFRRAYTLYPNAPTLALGLARALAGNGKVVAAEETYNKIIRDGAPPGNQVFAKAVDDAKAEIGSVSSKIAYATLNVTGPETSKVTLDGQSLAWAALGGKRPVDPGDHTLKATAEGYKPAESRFRVDPGKETVVSVTMEKESGGAGAVTPPPGGTTTTPPPPGSATTPPPGGDTGLHVSTKGGSSNKTLGFVALGVGGAGLAVGAITGLIAIGKHGDLKDKCTLPNSACPPDQQDNLDSYHTMGTISTIGFVVGGVGLAAGAILILTAPKETAQSAYISPYVGPGSFGATGRF
jgi:hypothetical protein